MRHKKDTKKKLGRNKSARKSLMRNMAISFFQYQQIQTTETKAKQLRRIVEKLITDGKKGDIVSIRRINQFLNHPKSIKRIKQIAAKYTERKGGYTQIIKIGKREGDGAEKVIIKLV